MMGIITAAQSGTQRPTSSIPKKTVFIDWDGLVGEEQEQEEEGRSRRRRRREGLPGRVAEDLNDCQRLLRKFSLRFHRLIISPPSTVAGGGGGGVPSATSSWSLKTSQLVLKAGLLPQPEGSMVTFRPLQASSSSSSSCYCDCDFGGKTAIFSLSEADQRSRSLRKLGELPRLAFHVLVEGELLALAEVYLPSLLMHYRGGGSNGVEVVEVKLLVQNTSLASAASLLLEVVVDPSSSTTTPPPPAAALPSNAMAMSLAVTLNCFGVRVQTAAADRALAKYTVYYSLLASGVADKVVDKVVVDRVVVTAQGRPQPFSLAFSSPCPLIDILLLQIVTPSQPVGVVRIPVAHLLPRLKQQQEEQEEEVLALSLWPWEALHSSAKQQPLPVKIYLSWRSTPYYPPPPAPPPPAATTASTILPDQQHPIEEQEEEEMEEIAVEELPAPTATTTPSSSSSSSPGRLLVKSETGVLTGLIKGLVLTSPPPPTTASATSAFSIPAAITAATSLPWVAAAGGGGAGGRWTTQSYSADIVSWPDGQKATCPRTPLTTLGGGATVAGGGGGADKEVRGYLLWDSSVRLPFTWALQQRQVAHLRITIYREDLPMAATRSSSSSSYSRKVVAQQSLDLAPLLLSSSSSCCCCYLPLNTVAQKEGGGGGIWGYLLLGLSSSSSSQLESRLGSMWSLFSRSPSLSSLGLAQQQEEEEGVVHLVLSSSSSTTTTSTLTTTADTSYLLRLSAMDQQGSRHCALLKWVAAGGGEVEGSLSLPLRDPLPILTASLLRTTTAPLPSSKAEEEEEVGMCRLVLPAQELLAGLPLRLLLPLRDSRDLRTALVDLSLHLSHTSPPPATTTTATTTSPSKAVATKTQGSGRRRRSSRVVEVCFLEGSIRSAAAEVYFEVTSSSSCYGRTRYLPMSLAYDSTPWPVACRLTLPWPRTTSPEEQQEEEEEEETLCVTCRDATQPAASTLGTARLALPSSSSSPQYYWLTFVSPTSSSSSSPWATGSTTANYRFSPTEKRGGSDGRTTSVEVGRVKVALRECRKAQPSSSSCSPPPAPPSTSLFFCSLCLLGVSGQRNEDLLTARLLPSSSTTTASSSSSPGVDLVALRDPSKGPPGVVREQQEEGVLVGSTALVPGQSEVAVEVVTSSSCSSLRTSLPLLRLLPPPPTTTTTTSEVVEEEVPWPTLDQLLSSAVGSKGNLKTSTKRLRVAGCLVPTLRGRLLLRLLSVYPLQRKKKQQEEEERVAGVMRFTLADHFAFSSSSSSSSTTSTVLPVETEKVVVDDPRALLLLHLFPPLPSATTTTSTSTNGYYPSLSGKCSTAPLYLEAMRNLLRCRPGGQQQEEEEEEVWHTVCIPLYTHPSSSSSATTSHPVAVATVRLAFEVQRLPARCRRQVNGRYSLPKEEQEEEEGGSSAGATSGSSSRRRRRVELSLKKAFTSCDKDHSGTVSLEELLAVLGQQGGAGGGGEALTLLRLLQPPPPPAAATTTSSSSSSARDANASLAAVRAVLDCLDIDRDGSVSWWEWRAVLTAALATRHRDKQEEEEEQDMLDLMYFAASLVLEARHRGDSNEQVDLYTTEEEEEEEVVEQQQVVEEEGVVASSSSTTTATATSLSPVKKLLQQEQQQQLAEGEGSDRQHYLEEITRYKEVRQSLGQRVVSLEQRWRATQQTATERRAAKASLSSFLLRRALPRLRTRLVEHRRLLLLLRLTRLMARRHLLLHLRSRRTAAVKLQRCARGWLTRRSLRHRLGGVVTAQRLWRGVVARRRARDYRHLLHRLAVLIRQSYRRYKARQRLLLLQRSALVLARNLRVYANKSSGRKILSQKKRERRESQAALAIQTAFHKKKQREEVRGEGERRRLVLRYLALRAALHPRHRHRPASLTEAVRGFWVAPAPPPPPPSGSTTPGGGAGGGEKEEIAGVPLKLIGEVVAVQEGVRLLEVRYLFLPPPSLLTTAQSPLDTKEEEKALRLDPSLDYHFHLLLLPFDHPHLRWFHAEPDPPLPAATPPPEEVELPELPEEDSVHTPEVVAEEEQEEEEERVEEAIRSAAGLFLFYPSRGRGRVVDFVSSPRQRIAVVFPLPSTPEDEQRGGEKEVLWLDYLDPAIVWMHSHKKHEVEGLDDNLSELDRALEENENEKEKKQEEEEEAVVVEVEEEGREEMSEKAEATQQQRQRLPPGLDHLVVHTTEKELAVPQLQLPLQQLQPQEQLPGLHLQQLDQLDHHEDVKPQPQLQLQPADRDDTPLPLPLPLPQDNNNNTIAQNSTQQQLQLPIHEQQQLHLQQEQQQEEQEEEEEELVVIPSSTH